MYMFRRTIWSMIWGQSGSCVGDKMDGVLSTEYVVSCKSEFGFCFGNDRSGPNVSGVVCFYDEVAVGFFSASGVKVVSSDCLSDSVGVYFFVECSGHRLIVRKGLLQGVHYSG